MRLYYILRGSIGLFVRFYAILFTVKYLTHASSTQKYEEFEELKRLHHVEILKQRKVIAMTVDGAAMRAKLIGGWYNNKMYRIPASPSTKTV